MGTRQGSIKKNRGHTIILKNRGQAVIHVVCPLSCLRPHFLRISVSPCLCPCLCIIGFRRPSPTQPMSGFLEGFVGSGIYARVQTEGT